MRALAAITVTIALGCSDAASSDVALTLQPMFDARVTGAVTSDFRGTAFFQLTGYPGSRMVTILAYERRLPESDMLELIWFSATEPMPTPGTYQISNPDVTARATSGFYALYHGQHGTTQSFASDSGSLTLRASDAFRIAGSFRFYARRYCVYDGSPCHPSDATASSPLVLLQGTFLAPPLQPER